VWKSRVRAPLRGDGLGDAARDGRARRAGAAGDERRLAWHRYRRSGAEHVGMFAAMFVVMAVRPRSTPVAVRRTCPRSRSPLRSMAPVSRRPDGLRSSVTVPRPALRRAWLNPVRSDRGTAGDVELDPGPARACASSSGSPPSHCRRWRWRWSGDCVRRSSTRAPRASSERRRRPGRRPNRVRRDPPRAPRWGRLDEFGPHRPS
jgi:hypothetical protein